MAATAVIKSGDVRDAFRAAVNDLVGPGYRYKDALLVQWINDAVKWIWSVNQDSVNDDALLMAAPAAITSISTSADIALKAPLQEAIVLFMQYKAALRDGDEERAGARYKLAETHLARWGRG